MFTQIKYAKGDGSSIPVNFSSSNLYILPKHFPAILHLEVCMRFAFVLMTALAAASISGQLYVSPAGAGGTVVYRADGHVVALGEAQGTDARILAEADRGLDGFALVTVRNENGVLQATELGEVVYRNGRTLIIKLYRPLTGDFFRSDVFSVKPLSEDRSSSTPVPIPVRGGYDDTVSDIVAAVSEDSLISITTNYQSYLTRYSNTDGFDTACDWSNARFLSYGLDSEIRHFSMLGYDCQNVIATQTGTVYPDQYWIICGHLDSTSPNTQYDAPGADDNGSGSAAVMEAARIMSQYDFEFTVRYCLWGGEEQGLYGSAHYADSVAAAGDEILGVVNLDMIFYGPTPDDIAELHYNTASQGLGLAFDAISDTYVPALSKSVASSPVSASDHASFWSVGYPAMLSIEKEVWNNPYYHQTTDVITNYLQYFPFGTNMAKAAIATVAYLAVPVNTGVEEESHHGLNGGFELQPLRNPISGNASLTVAIPSGGPVSIVVYDTSGRTVLNASEELQEGLNQVNIDTGALPPGMYLVKADASGASASTRLMVVR